MKLVVCIVSVLLALCFVSSSSAHHKPGPHNAVHAIRAAFPDALEVTAICIAQHESGLSAWAISPTNDHGLFQFNAPSWRGNSIFERAYERQWKEPWEWRMIYNPWKASRAAYTLYLMSGSSWGPWAVNYAC